MNKRISSRAIIIEKDSLLTMFRRKIKLKDLEKMDINAKDKIQMSINHKYVKIDDNYE